ncbi:MAG: transposase, partial [Chloroflexi bacterium]|nr:transposase [Chloroflexota bacterium]
MSIDRKKVAAEARYDGKFVLRTNTSLPASEVAVQYKRLLLVEQFFRTTKSLLETRPIFHQWDATIRGHVFCSFLALVLMDELKRRLSEQGLKIEWDMVRQYLEALEQAQVREGDQWYLLRSPLQGVAGKVLHAVGVAPPPSIRPVENVVP